MNEIDPAIMLLLESVMSASEFEKLTEYLARPGARCGEVLACLSKVCQSALFARSDETKRFLAWAVGMPLLGLGATVKESTGSMALYGLYDAKATARFRALAKRAKDTSKIYYLHAGKNDAIEIRFSNGGYVPEFIDRWSKVHVMPTENWNPNGGGEALCAAVNEAILCRLQATVGVVASRDHIVSNQGKCLRLKTSFQTCGERVCVHGSLSNVATGEVVAWLTLEGPRDHAIQLGRNLAEALLPHVLPPGAMNPAA